LNDWVSLAEATDRTPWIDSHEHLVEERRRLGPDPYVFTGAWGDRICIPGGWTALLAHYAVDDSSARGSIRLRRIASSGTPASRSSSGTPSQPP
jgi:hypothetical protein